MFTGRKPKSPILLPVGSPDLCCKAALSGMFEKAFARSVRRALAAASLRRTYPDPTQLPGWRLGLRSTRKNRYACSSSSRSQTASVHLLPCFNFNQSSFNFLELALAVPHRKKRAKTANSTNVPAGIEPQSR